MGPLRLKSLCIHTASSEVCRFSSCRPSRQPISCQAHKAPAFGSIAAATLAATTLLAGSAQALSYNELQGLTYQQVKGSGVANTCPVLNGPSDNFKDLKSGDYKLDHFCMEPTSFRVKDDAAGNKGKAADYVDTKLLTRLTYTLDQMTANFKLGNNGEVQFKEEDGIDYAAVTVQLPGGERVPFLFTVKQLAANGTLDSFSGDYNVPSYRGSTFMDPKGRGGSTGYDNAIALPAGGAGDEEGLQKENDKQAIVRKGSIVFSVGKVDAGTGEIAGVFQSIQPTDDDMGAKTPKDLKTTGLWYGQLNKV